MKVGLDGSRLLLALFLAALFYLLLLPSLWPQPGAKVQHEKVVAFGEDLPLAVTVSAWHPNFSVRRIRFSINNVNSPAFLDSRPLLPINLHGAEAVSEWKVTFPGRLTFPRKASFLLTAPLGTLAKKGTFGTGTLRGTVDVDVDYTEVSMKADFPARSVLLRVPWEVEVTR